MRLPLRFGCYVVQAEPHGGRKPGLSVQQALIPVTAILDGTDLRRQAAG